MASQNKEWTLIARGSHGQVIWLATDDDATDKKVVKEGKDLMKKEAKANPDLTVVAIYEGILSERQAREGHGTYFVWRDGRATNATGRHLVG